MPTTKSITAKILYTLTILVFLGWTSWWLYNNFMLEPDARSNELFTDSYWVLPLVGGVAGLWAAQKWGGLKSVLGRAISLFSLGLLLQVFGQVVYSYYALFQDIEAPYPSLGDVGFFGSVILYILALVFLAKAAGARLSGVSWGKKVIAFGLPVVLLAASYMVFLKGYEFDTSNMGAAILDFAYPLSQAFYISLALLVYFLSRGLLGGIMKNKVLLIIGALVVQYLADYMFLLRINRETWYPGDISDFIYLVAYFLMAISLLRLGSTAQSLRKGVQI